MTAADSTEGKRHMATNAERLAMRLIDQPMTMKEIRAFLGSQEKPMSAHRAKKAIRSVRDMLPSLGAWLPRPTHESQYTYRVLENGPTSDADKKLHEDGALAMLKDNRSRLVTMLETAEPYADVLDKRTKLGKEAEHYANVARAALSALDLMGE